MKEFRWPWLWLGIWVALVSAIVAGSLGPPTAVPEAPGGDKLAHFGSYAVLTVWSVQVFSRWRPLLLVAAGTVAFGVGIEIAQGALTADRMMDVLDALANTVGVGLGLLVSLLPGRDLLLRCEKARPARGASTERLP